MNPAVYAGLGIVAAAVVGAILKFAFDRLDKKRKENRIEADPAADADVKRYRLLKRLRDKQAGNDVQP
ncbi:MAG: hypothetical protein K9M45_01655 [Kiritimatiellales bacterium]|nr:hypothetical protein [Kiritimatiellales bacterium]